MKLIFKNISSDQEYEQQKCWWQTGVWGGETDGPKSTGRAGKVSLLNHATQVNSAQGFLVLTEIIIWQCPGMHHILNYISWKQVE